jgi:hypothetical protein
MNRVLFGGVERSTNNFDYVASDTAGKTSTSTRTVIVESPAAAEPAPTP